MNHNRSAFHPKRNPRATTHEREQHTVHNTHTSLTKYSTSKQSQAEKAHELAQKVMVYVNKFQQPQSQLKIITRETLKDGGSKIFYEVFAMLGRVTDDRLEASELNP